MSKIYAIGDLHLSFGEGVDKPMDIYGKAWVRHTERLEENWRQIITEEDTVILAGDLSWALKLPDALPDMDWVHGLPGRKIAIKGNHDLWWTGIQKMNQLYDDLYFLQNFSAAAGDIAICGSRGWLCPGSEGYEAADEKIYNRELLRLERSLTDAKAKGYTKIIGVLHFPPTNDKQQSSGFTELFTAAGASQVVYGHLHGEESYKNGLQGYFNGVEYKLVSLDYLNCMPLLLEETKASF